MGTQKTVRRAASLLASASLVVAVSCLAPTEVTLVLTTDVPCTEQDGTSIAVGDPSDIATSAPVTVTGDCTLMDGSGVGDGGALPVPANIGSLVVVPSASRSASFTVEVVIALDPVAQPSDCAALNYQGCIVARRQLSFIPHTPLTLPIELTLDCKNLPCNVNANETCYHGQCMTADTTCTGSGCVLAVPTPDASSSDDDAPEEVSVAEAGFDATVGMSDAPSADEPPPMEASSTVAPEASLQDAPSEGAPVETPDAAPEASIHDAASEVGAVQSDASDASAPPAESGAESDASPVGVCLLDAGQSSGVECGASRCATAGDVCCVAFYSGQQPSEQCTTLSGCNYNGTGVNPIYSALGCRTAGDCAAGHVCCATASASGSGTITQCATSCTTIGVTQRTACQNSCECPSGYPQCNAETCPAGYSIGICGATSGSECPE